MGEVVITGVAGDYRYPGVLAELVVAQGEGAANVGQREAVFAMPMLSTGSGTAAVLKKLENEQAAIDLAGAGSPLHRGVRKFRQCNRLTPTWALPVAETSGGTPVAADVDVTWTTDPTADGATTVRVCDADCTYNFIAGTDTVTTIAAGIAALINAKTHLPVTAANAAGVLTITAKLDGESQGDGSVGVIQVNAEIDAGVTTTVSPATCEVGDTTAGAEGSTTEAANLATALATIDSRRIYYVVSSAFAPDVAGDVAIDNLTSHISTKSSPIPGHRSTGIVAFTGAPATAQLLAVAQNYERLILACQENSDHDLAELAGNVAAVLALEENSDATHNFCDYSGPAWQINAAYNSSDWPTATEVNDMINDGVTPIESSAAGSRLTCVVCTRSKDSAGTNNDFRATERQRVSGGDFVLDMIQTWIGKNGKGKKLVDDNRLDDGSVDPNQKLPGHGVWRPSNVKGGIIKILQDCNADSNQATYSHLQKVQQSIDSLNVGKSGVNPARVYVGVDLYTVDHFNQATIRAAETTAA